MLSKLFFSPSPYKKLTLQSTTSCHFLSNILKCILMFLVVLSVFRIFFEWNSLLKCPYIYVRVQIVSLLCFYSPNGWKIHENIVSKKFQFNEMPFIFWLPFSISNSHINHNDESVWFVCWTKLFTQHSLNNSSKLNFTKKNIKTEFHWFMFFI